MKKYLIRIAIVVAVLGISVLAANSFVKLSTDSNARDRTANFMAAMLNGVNTVQICEDRATAFGRVNGSIAVALPTSDNNSMFCTDLSCCLKMRRIQGDQDTTTFDGIKDALTHQRNVSFFLTKTGYAIVFGHRDAGTQRD